MMFVWVFGYCCFFLVVVSGRMSVVVGVLVVGFRVEFCFLL